MGACVVGLVGREGFHKVNPPNSKIQLTSAGTAEVALRDGVHYSSSGASVLAVDDLE
jgi:hypothetical protein